MEKQKQSDPIPPPPQSRKIPGLVLGLGFVLQSNTTLGLSIKPCSPPPIPESVTTPPIIFINYNKSGSLIVGGFQHYTTAQRLPVSSITLSPPLAHLLPPPPTGDIKRIVSSIFILPLPPPPSLPASCALRLNQKKSLLYPPSLPASYAPRLNQSLLYTIQYGSGLPLLD